MKFRNSGGDSRKATNPFRGGLFPKTIGGSGSGVGFHAANCGLYAVDSPARRDRRIRDARVNDEFRRLDRVQSRESMRQRKAHRYDVNAYAPLRTAYRKNRECCSIVRSAQVKSATGLGTLMSLMAVCEVVSRRWKGLLKRMPKIISDESIWLP